MQIEKVTIYITEFFKFSVVILTNQLLFHSVLSHLWKWHMCSRMVTKNWQCKRSCAIYQSRHQPVRPESWDGRVVHTSRQWDASV